MKATLNMNLYWVQYENSKPQLSLYDSPNMGEASPYWTLVREMEIDVEAPDDFDPRPQQIAALRAKKQEVLAETQAKVNNIEEQITRLLAIEHKPEVA